MKIQLRETPGFRKTVLLAGFAAVIVALVAPLPTRSAEPIPAPAAVAPTEGENAQPLIEIPSGSQAWDEYPRAELRIFPAVLETRRYGPVEEPEPEFYALRNSDEPGFDWTPPAGFGYGWGGYGLGGFGYHWPGYGYGWGYGAPFPRYGIGLVGYNRYYSRPWYASPSPQVWSTRYPWYSPAGAGPNIYQPWYQSRSSVPWYSPYGIGPNIYTPSYSWQSYYPWYAPNGAGPNIYTPSWQYDGCLYW